MNYTPLHVHSDASLDGAGTVHALVSEAKRLGMQHLALTDHGTLANSVAFWSECDQQGIVPILGMEAYLLYKGKRHHITLLSLNEEGFNNLVWMDTDSHTNNYVNGYPLVTLDMLDLYKDGIFALTGCISSALYDGTEIDASLYVADLLSIYSRNYLAMETMFIGSHDTWSRPLGLSPNMGVPYVITNDTHYPCREQFHAHQTICSARRGFTYDSQHLWLKSGDEILHEGSKYRDRSVIEWGLQNSVLIGNLVTKWNMKAAPTLPYIENVQAQLEDALRQALVQDVATKGQKKTRLERLRREFRVLHEKKFLDYIFILWDIVKWAKGQDIYVGPGRGSGGGSYVLYLLGITGVDPIEHGLLFERFINPSRSDYPDIDTDFESDRRQEVMNYARERWGTLPIATYSCYSHKSAIHDIARVLTIPKDLEIPASEGSRDSEAFVTFVSDKPEALSTYDTMIGQIRHRGKHAAGVIIPNRPVPIERAGDELVAAWAEGMNTKDLSKVGIVKYDLLGLTALSQLKTMENMVGVPFKHHWEYDDPVVFDLFCQGDVAGIFQWSGSDGIRELTMRVAPRNFYDLTTCNALYRPGALDAGTAERYPEYMKHPRKLHPRLDPLLEKTYGVICYQEQVMAVVAEILGGDLAQADLARRLLAKAAVGDPKWEKEIELFQLDFYVKGRENGFDSDLLNSLWAEVYTHSGYSYNLSHATTYTMISYQMAWYKAYHRPAFTASVLQYDKANAQTYMLDAISHGLRIEMPHVNHSTLNYELRGEKIYIPLSDVAFLGEKGASFLVQDVEKNGPYPTYEDFSARVPKKVCNNRARVLLERIGAFSGLGGDPTSAINGYTDIAVGDTYQTQLEILGYVVPSRTLVEKMQGMAALPAKKGNTRFAGFISQLKNKRSEHGEYTVYTLSPSGSFWCRNPKPSLKVGAFVSGTKSTYGNSTDYKVYKLSD